MATSKISDRLFQQVLVYLESLYDKFGTGTGTQFFNNTSTQLTSPVQIQSGVFGVGFDEITITGSNTLNFKGFLEPGEPVVQPVLLGELGIQDSTGSVDTLGVGARLNVPVTKDNTTRFRVRGSLGLLRK